MLTKTDRTMTIHAFGEALLATQDLDPVYIGLVGADLSRRHLARWLLSYWCFYHVGAASRLSEFAGREYWDGMLAAARNTTSPRDYGLPADRWPRAAERRHFRGGACVKAVEYLKSMGPLMQPPEHGGYTDPLQVVEFLATATTEKQVMSIAQGWPLFGPWISFKVADMMERVWGAAITFAPDAVLMYKEPRAALQLLVNTDPGYANFTPGQAYDRLLARFAPRPAPPRGDRGVGPQEVETILCCWKGYMNGTYWVGKDIHEQRAALAGWGPTAERILKAYPSEVPAQAYA